VVTCFLRYVIDPGKSAEFEDYGRRWLNLVVRFGGLHHGYFLPAEGANNIAYAMFSFPSLAAYERYRFESARDPECIAAYEYAHESRCIVSYDRSFLRPILPADGRAS
jgi:hypothetical protein